MGAASARAMQHDVWQMAGGVMGTEASGTDELPGLDAFDQEFAPAAALRMERRAVALRRVAGLLLAIAIVSGPVLAWLYTDGRPLSDGHSSFMALQSAGGDASEKRP